MSSNGGMYMVVNGVAIKKNDYEKYMYVKSRIEYDQQPPSYSEIYNEVTPPKESKRRHKKKCPDESITLKEWSSLYHKS
jgi:hypothetical protein